MKGKSIGRYHILEQLGEGGMATVYKAYDTRLERDVAIKFLRTERLDSQRAIKRFEIEAKALAKLNHPNIVQVLDFGEYEGIPYLVMEYVSGGTLKLQLGQQLPWQQASKLLTPIASALEYAHENHLIHRDVKPSNILITSAGIPKLSDFGIAKMLESEETMDLTGTSVGMGTPFYMSPEQGKGQPIDIRTDIYSLGIVFYELLTGRKPYQADTPMAVIYQHVEDPLPKPSKIVSSIPVHAERFLYKALAKDPNYRFNDMGEMADALEKMGMGIKIRVSAPGYFTRQTIIIISVIAAVAVLAVAGVLILPSVLPSVSFKVPKTPSSTVQRESSVISGLPNTETKLVESTQITPSPTNTFMIVPSDTPTVTPSVTPTSTNSPTPTDTLTPQISYDLAFASDRDGEFAVYLMDTQTGEWKKLPRPSDYERVWWPSFCGDVIAAEVYDTNKTKSQGISLLDPGGSGTSMLSQQSGVERLGVPRCSPDGRYLSYSADVGSIWGLYILDTQNQNTYSIFPSNGFVSGYASWPLYGQEFIFYVIEQGSYKEMIYRNSDLSRSDQYKIADGANPSLSPDGNQMVYVCSKPSDNIRELCLLDSGFERGLVDVVRKKISGFNIQASSAWSADGQWVYYASAEDGDWDIYRIRSDGTGKQNLTDAWNSNEIMPALKW